MTLGSIIRTSIRLKPSSEGGGDCSNVNWRIPENCAIKAACNALTPDGGGNGGRSTVGRQHSARYAGTGVPPSRRSTWALSRLYARWRSRRPPILDRRDRLPIDPSAAVAHGVDALNNSLGFADPASTFRYFSKTSFSPNGINWGHYADPRVGGLLMQGSAGLRL